VIGLVIDGVNTNNVDAELLEVLDITLADLGVGQRILISGSTTRLVVDTSEVKALIASPESYYRLIFKAFRIWKIRNTDHCRKQ